VASLPSLLHLIIDLQAAEPFEFTSISDLKGCLYLHPYNPHFYFLDFIDDSGTRRDVANLYVYPYEYLSRDYGELEPMCG